MLSQEGASWTRTHQPDVKFKGILEFVSYQLVASYTILSESPTSTIQLIKDGKLCTRLVDRNIRVLHAKNYENQFKLLLVIEENLAHIFWDTLSLYDKSIVKAKKCEIRLLTKHETILCPVIQICSALCIG